MQNKCVLNSIIVTHTSTRGDYAASGSPQPEPMHGLTQKRFFFLPFSIIVVDVFKVKQIIIFFSCNSQFLHFELSFGLSCSIFGRAVNAIDDDAAEIVRVNPERECIECRADDTIMR